MNKVLTALLILVGIIHLLPLSGVLGAERLTALYGLSFNENNLSILMRHRAVLFGLFGAFFIFAAFKPMYQPLAFIAGFISVVSFMLLAWMTGGYNHAIQKVVWADVVAAISLIIATALYFFKSDKS